MTAFFAVPISESFPTHDRESSSFVRILLLVRSGQMQLEHPSSQQESYPRST